MSLYEKDEQNIIDIDNSRTSHAFFGKNLIWGNELKRIFNLLNEHRQGIRDQNAATGGFLTNRGYGRDTDVDPGLIPEARNTLAIGLFGTYGSGKTSLLETLETQVNGGEFFIHAQRGASSNDRWAYSLPVMRPSFINSRHHFLYGFIANALKLDADKNGRSDEHFLTPVQESFHQLSQHLQAINEEQEESGKDPLNISLDRLDRHTSTLELKACLGSFIDNLSKSLPGNGSEEKLILLPVDDVDLSLKSLASSLELFKHFLRHPKLVPVFTFSGRLGEELMRRKFEQDMQLEPPCENNEGSSITEAASNLTVIENLAIHYLNKLFPVRNRIRLTNASGRILSAKVTSVRLRNKYGQDCPPSGTSVYNLLETCSRLLFGYPNWPVGPEVNSPFRSATVRRQLQIVDAITASDVDQLMYEIDPTLPANPGALDFSWGVAFDKMTWSLMNIHRDILRENRLDLEDLYSWTRSGLCEVLLRNILSKPITKRNEVFEHWLYGTDTRRSNMLSLIAANMFRPRMMGEEPSPDDLALLKNMGTVRSIENEKRKGKPGDENFYLMSFSVRKGALWFLNLWLGFYLPQFLARKRWDTNEKLQKSNINDKGGDLPGFSPVGWNLRSGATHAIREALHNQSHRPIGMLFLNTKQFNHTVKRLKSVSDNIVAISGIESLDADLQKLDLALTIVRIFKASTNQEEENKNTGKILRITLGDEPLATIETYINEDNQKGFLNTTYEDIALKFHLVPQDFNVFCGGKFTRENPNQNDDFSGKVEGEDMRALAWAIFQLENNVEWCPLLLNLWTFYGNHRGVAWTAVSFWRGLSLMGMLLKADSDFRISNPNPYRSNNLNINELKKYNDNHNNIIRDLIYKHLTASKVWGEPLSARFNSNPEEDIEDFQELRFATLGPLILKLVKSVEFWLERFSHDRMRIRPLQPLKESKGKERSPGDNPRERRAYRACYIRRIHGENMVGRFGFNMERIKWSELTKKEGQNEKWNAKRGMLKWCKELSRYWQCGKESNLGNADMEQNKTQALFLSCPFLEPFALDFDTLVPEHPETKESRQTVADSRSKASAGHVQFQMEKEWLQNEGNLVNGQVKTILGASTKVAGTTKGSELAGKIRHHYPIFMSDKKLWAGSFVHYFEIDSFEDMDKFSKSTTK